MYDPENPSTLSRRNAMYIPAVFVESDQTKLHAFIEQHSFATLVSHHAGDMQASHLPILLDHDHGSHGRLVGHMATANSQWHEAEGQRVLTIFDGPHAYISPTWYESENVVPTWNYVTVHASGVFRIIKDADQLRSLIVRTVDLYESRQPQPWRMESQDTGFIDKLLSAIVGFTIEIETLEGKWKLNQNHNVERRERVIARLEACDDEDSRQVASLMRETLV
jgi:transcriptional regulator